MVLDWSTSKTETIRVKWVYKLKLNPDSSTDKYKAMLVAKGFLQIIEIDYFDVFAHSSKNEDN